jgi:hypothetical protein
MTCNMPVGLYATPSRAGVMAKEVFSVPIRMSQTMASSTAPPQTLPSSMAITGAGQR